MSGRVRSRQVTVLAGKAYARAPRKPQPRYPVDWALVAELDATGDGRSTRPKANGRCHECGKQVPPMRHLCGRCFALDPRGVHRGELDRDPHMWPAVCGDTLRTMLSPVPAGAVVDWTGDQA